MSHGNWSKASLDELLEYLQQQHCEIKGKLLELNTLIEQPNELPKDEYSSILKSLQVFFPTFKTELENHFAREENILIPYIYQMEEFSRNQSAKFEFYEGGIKNPISQMEYDHDQTENVMFEKFRSITKNYQLY